MGNWIAGIVDICIIAMVLFYAYLTENPNYLWLLALIFFTGGYGSNCKCKCKEEEQDE